MSLRNITIASSNDTAAIVYDPPVCNGGGWTTNGTQVDPSGLYKSCTITSSSKGITPSANLTFTGVAVYYVSPTFNGQFVTFILDDAAPINVDLSKPGGDASALAQVMWMVSSLKSTQHILQLRPVNGNRTLNVGSFIVTQQIESNTTTVVSPTAIPSSLVGGLSSTLGPPTQSTTTTHVAIALGTTFGTLSFLIFLAISFFLWRRNNTIRKRFSWNPPIPPIRSSVKPTIHSRPHTLDSFPSPKTTGSDLPMHPIASVEPGVSVQEFDPDEPSPTKGWVFPTQSHSRLIQNFSSTSSQGHDDLLSGPSAYKLQPVRARSDSESIHGQSVSGQAFISRNTTVSSRLEPVRAPSAQSYSQRSPPPAFTETGYVNNTEGSAYTPSVSRNTTFNSARLEPVRRGSSATPVPE